MIKTRMRAGQSNKNINFLAKIHQKIKKLIRIFSMLHYYKVL